MNKITRLFLIITLVVFYSCSQEQPAEQSQEVAMIGRDLIFGNPERASVQISPDGEYMSYLAPHNGVLNVFVAPIGQPDQAEVVTNDTTRGVRIYFWSYRDDNLLYMQDVGGDENWNVHVVDVKSKETTNLTPFEEILGPDGLPATLPNGKIMRPRADILAVSEKKPDEILIQLNKDDARYRDVYKVNLESGDLEKVVDDEGFLQFVTDDDYNVVLGVKNLPDGSLDVLKNKDGEWENYFNVPKEDGLSFGIIGMNKDNNGVYMIDSRDRNTAALTMLDLSTDEVSIIAEDDKSDIQGGTQHPTEKTIQAVRTNYLKAEWVILDENIQADFDFLSEVEEGQINITTRSQDDNLWTIAYTASDSPVKYYLYNREEQTADYLFSNRPALEEFELAKMYPLEIPSRDGLTLVSYLTLPTDKDKGGKVDEPLPLMLWVHGGPWARNSFGYNSVHQWLANRGYAVLSVNYRGSTGFGKDFINAAIKEWAGKMHDDLIDAVDYVVEEGIADPEKVAIGGGSYGGYATLVGVTFTPDKFACGVDIVGPSNLNTLLSTIPPYWEAFFETFALHVGDPRTEDGQALLEERSPLNKVDAIVKPLLIGQGANDPRVKQTESDQIVTAMEEKSIPVTYVLYPDEGHGFARPENRLSFFAITEKFLSEHLGGRAEDFGDDFEGSSVEVPNGAEHVPDLADMLEPEEEEDTGDEADSEPSDQ